MNDDPARMRFFVIQIARIFGVIMVVVGLLIEGGRIELPRIAGFALIAMGLIEAFIVPVALARMWRTPK